MYKRLGQRAAAGDAKVLRLIGADGVIKKSAVRKAYGAAMEVAIAGNYSSDLAVVAAVKINFLLSNAS